MAVVAGEWVRATRPSSVSRTPRSKAWSEMSKDELVDMIQDLRLQNKLLDARYEISRRWLEEFGQHTPECPRSDGRRCICGLAVFLEG